MVKAVCQVVDCSEDKNGDITLHKVPTNVEDAAPWICFLEMANMDYPTYKKAKRIEICSKHFQKDDFRVGVTGRRNLIKGRFPSLHKNHDLSNEIKVKCGIQDEEQDDHTESHVKVIDTVHEACNAIITSQMNAIQELKNKILKLEEQNRGLKTEINELKTKTIRNLTLRARRQDENCKQKEKDLLSIQLEMKQLKEDWCLPPPSTDSDTMLMELIMRRNAHKSKPFSNKLKVFAFNCMYISPKGYRFLHSNFPTVLPHPRSSSYWMKDVHACPGLLRHALFDIKSTCSNPEKPIYYSLAFDEMAIRQQLLFDGTKMIGTIDYGKVLLSEEKGLAKSALFCMATELNGRKSFPIAYILTNGLKSVLMAEFVKACIFAVNEAGGNVLSITFDGLRSNFTAMEQLGANLRFDCDEYKPFLSLHGTTVHIVPDASHMVKLVRNTLDRVKCLYNEDNEKINWEYVKMLTKVQEEEGLRPGTKITGLHTNFHSKKMNTKLCVQLLSNSTATGIDFCRKIGLPEFSGSEATTEFLRVCDMIFDILNTKPYGKGKEAPLSMHNKINWSSIIKSAKQYLMTLKVFDASQIIPLYQTKFGTCVKGLITSLTSITNIMNEMENGKVKLYYLPTYRLSQDPIEIYFGTLRSRLGCNDNPNVLQLSYSVRATLCFKLNACTTGNCQPQEDLLDCVNTGNAIYCSEDEDDEDMDDDGDEVPSALSNLSLFVENIVVYIAGFVAKKLRNRLDCDVCKSALITNDKEYIGLREDFYLLLDKDRGGLCKPSEDIIIVCKISERIIRQEQCGGVLKLNAEKLAIIIRKECLTRNLFHGLHTEYFSSSLRLATLSIHCSHKMHLINEISKLYSKVRLHYIAKNHSFHAKSLSKRHKLRKIVHFRNE